MNETRAKEKEEEEEAMKINFDCISSSLFLAHSLGDLFLYNTISIKLHLSIKASVDESERESVCMHMQ
jgi:hypothetical protein